ncbi:MAG: S41 family peptidase [Vicinamibacterales bacterium]
MRPLLVIVLLAATVFGSSAAQSPPSREIDNVAAFSRLYGVVRYFYPGDAAAALDWDRFAVHGVRRVRVSPDAKALEATLKRLFAPLGSGLEIGATLPRLPAAGPTGDRLVAWRYLGPGFAASSVRGPYKSKRTNRADTVGASIDGFVTIMQSIPAEILRGKTIRLRGQARVKTLDTTGSGALWLRVDRPDRAMGFFDNMGNRPIREGEWREYAIEGPVAPDATNVAFGVMASGTATADFDRIELSVRDADGGWIPMQIADFGFEAASESASGSWFRAGTSKTAAITRPSGEAPEGRQFLRFAPGGSGSVSTAELFADAPPIAGAHVDLALGSGLNARVPLALSNSQATVDAKQSLEALAMPLSQSRNPRGEFDVDIRLADIVVAWNVFRHFYPYWTEAAVDWDARLRPQLEDALRANTRKAHHDALRRLVADARDGHGGVFDTEQVGPPAALPIQLGLVEQRVVITASAASDVPVGAVVSSIDGVQTLQRLTESMRLASGTTQWKQVRALGELTTCSQAAPVTLVLDSGTGTSEVRLHCEGKQPPSEKRPEPISEVAPGVWYVDLTRARMAEITPMLGQLSRASGVVFDARGYPTDSGAGILPHLIDAREHDRWMHIPKIVGPFGQYAGWYSAGWELTPRQPHLGGRIVFLTDRRAISYAESVMGYVADRKLGTIVGGTTAGTNGNVALFEVPGGFRISFTGMRVTRHDGQSAHHLIGVAPNISIAPTIASIREGHDVVLARAVELVHSGRSAMRQRPRRAGVGLH